MLAGAMIAVSATAVVLGFRIKTPALNAVFPSTIGWVLLTIVIGALFTTLAILVFEKLSRFAEGCSPWIFIVFIAGALAVLPRLGVRTPFRNFWEIWSTKIWNGTPGPG